MKKTEIGYLQWRNRVNEFTSSDMRIGTDIMLVKDGFTTLKDKPFRCDVTTCIIYIRGRVRFRINMKEFTAKAPCMIIMPYNAIIETLEVSDDILTRILVMSREFTDSLFSSPVNLPTLQQTVEHSPIIDLTGEEESLIHYYSMVKNLICRSDSPHRLEAIKHLTLALFYAYTSLKHSPTGDISQAKHERRDEIYEQFIELLRKNYKRERDVSFYAEKMCITPKYLSKAVREASGQSATEWIERYVITESKALLYSTDQTIQQIADALGFQSQSLFGKYFKRVVGISPREYRRGGKSSTEEE